MLQPPLDVAYESAYWNASVHNSEMWYDAETDSVYLWPQTWQGARFRNNSQPPGMRQLSCYGVLPPPPDAAPGGTLWASNASRYLYRRPAADVRARPWAGWGAGSGAEVIVMANAPAWSFRANQMVWLPWRRQLVAVGGVRVDNAAAAAPGTLPCTTPQDWVYSDPAVVQCLTVSRGRGRWWWWGGGGWRGGGGGG
jgi:hypothetical protein